jgi:sigma-B regulation protein RsbU (phosphoserine phosphatase)
VCPGDRLVLYTDGLVECTGPSGEMFGFDRVLEQLQRTAAGSPQRIVSELVRQLEDFVGRGARRDDVSAMAVSWS